MTAPDQKTRRWPEIAALCGFAVLVHFLSLALLPFVMAAILTFVTDPLINRVAKALRCPRWAAACGVYVAILAALGALAIGVGVTAGRDLVRLGSAGPDPVGSLIRRAAPQGGLRILGLRLTADEMSQDAANAIHQALRANALVKIGGAAFAAAAGAVLFLVSTFYMMISTPSLIRNTVRLIPPSKRAEFVRVTPGLANVARRYFIGVLGVVLVTSLAAWVGYGLALRVPGAALLSVAVGLLETVPVLGPITAGALVGLSALQLHSAGETAVMIAYAIGLRFAIDDVVAPLVLGRSLALHPLVIMLAYVLGAVLFGIVGLLVAAPACACFWVWLQDRYRLEEAEIG
jgi:predicted PurR-regulated permease PerM